MRIKPQTFLVLIVTFASCNSAWAQLPDQRNTVGDGSLRTLIRSSPTLSITPARRELGRSFWVPWGILAGLAVADNELTATCVHNPNCVEANPILGRRPTRLELYGVKGTLLGTAFYLSQKRKREGKSDWKIPLLIGIPVYGSVVILGAVHSEQHRSGL